MNKTQNIAYVIIATIMLSLSVIPATFASTTYVTGYDSEPEIAGYSWLCWNSSSDSAAIILYGGPAEDYKVTCRHLDYWVNEYNYQYTEEREDFIHKLHDNGIDVLTPNEFVEYTTSSTWLGTVAEWLQNRNYNNIYLFGWSAGGIAVGYEIQKPDADQLFTAAVIACAPVNWTACEGALFETAQTANETKVRTAFICHPNDEFSCYSQMQLYYDNMPVGLEKEWHMWGDPDDPQDYRHLPFPDVCQVCGKTIAHVVYDWVAGPILAPVDVVIDSDAQAEDPWSRYHGMTVDDPMSVAFWTENPSPVIDTTSGTMHYETTLYLTEGPHNLEYGVGAFAGYYWNVTITVNGEVVVDSENSDAYNHVVAEIYVEPQNCSFDIEAYTIYAMELPVWIKIDGEEVGTAFETYELSNGTYTFEVPQYVWFGMYTAYFLYWDYQDVHYDDITAEITISSAATLTAIYDFN